MEFDTAAAIANGRRFVTTLQTILRNLQQIGAVAGQVSGALAGVAGAANAMGGGLTNITNNVTTNLTNISNAVTNVQNNTTRAGMAWGSFMSRFAAGGIALAGLREIMEQTDQIWKNLE